MNYYEHHIGDYAEATAHLTFIEDAAYSRMIRKYYAMERPLPADIKAVQRLVGARTKDERDAVESVLQEFFTLQADGWHQTRCDADLQRYIAKQDKARASANARWSKPHGERNANALQTHMRTNSERNANASETHNERNALQSPVPRHQTPEETALAVSARDPDDPNTPTPEPPTTRAGAVCRRMKAAGLTAVNPAHPKLAALLAAGITDAELEAAAADAAQRGKGFAYALAAAEGQRRDAAVEPLPDRASITVPSRAGPDPALQRLEADRAAWKPPAPEVKAMIAQTVERLKARAS